MLSRRASASFEAMSAPELRDIESRADCELLVRAFYGKAMEDELIGWIFTDVAHLDLEEHVPVITSFWETVLLGDRSYFGSAFAVHAKIHAKAELKKAHFERWLILWCRTVDEMFDGERAAMAKVHGLRVANAQHAFLAALRKDRVLAHARVEHLRQR